MCILGNNNEKEKYTIPFWTVIPIERLLRTASYRLTRRTWKQKTHTELIVYLINCSLRDGPRDVCTVCTRVTTENTKVGVPIKARVCLCGRKSNNKILTFEAVRKFNHHRSKCVYAYGIRLEKNQIENLATRHRLQRRVRRDDWIYFVLASCV